MNNASLVGIGYTQTLRPGEEGPSITMTTTLIPIYISTLFVVFYGRNESDPLCPCGWEEYQCRWSQTRSWIGVGGIRRTLLPLQNTAGITYESDLNLSTVSGEMLQSSGNLLSSHYGHNS